MLRSMTPIDPIESAGEISSRRDLYATLRRIDGWGPNAWREVIGAWALRGCTVVFDPDESVLVTGDHSEADGCSIFLSIPHRLGQSESIATADWALRETWWHFVPSAGVRVTMLRPGQAIRATNACLVQGEHLVLRMRLGWPYQGMCIDAGGMRRLIRRLEGLAARLAMPTPGLHAHRRCVARARALRAALPEHGLVAFLAVGARLARSADGGPDPDCTPLAIPANQLLSIELPGFGTVTGLGIRSGITALAGAPYHGKSTVLAAIKAGIDDHIPGDGRELVVSVADTIPIQAEDGRLVHPTHLGDLFARLPGSDPTRFTTRRASGATSMAATVAQGIAAGARLLLIDEDTAAGNILAVDPLMRRLLGRAMDGCTTLLEVLPNLAKRHGVSALVVAGSSAAALAAADRVLVMQDYQPRDATRQAQRLAPAVVRCTAPHLGQPRQLTCAAEALLHGTHGVHIDVQECERPRLRLGSTWHTLDLRRCGWELDAERTRGALLAAAWCCRWHQPGDDLCRLADRYAEHTQAHGPSVLDPYHGDDLSLPPWPLVAAVLERLAVTVINDQS